MTPDLKTKGRPPGTYQELILYAERLAEERRCDEAFRILDVLIDDDPTDPYVLCIMGYCYSELMKNGLASVLFRAAQERMPKDNISALINLGQSLSRLWRHDEAIQVLREAERIEPNSTGVWINLAHALVWRGAAAQAIDYCNRILDVEPDNIPAYDNKAIAKLFLGQWGEGWDLYEVSLGYKFRKEFVYENEGRWQGTKGENLIVYGEQGLGDELLFSSCLAEAARHARTCYLDTQPKLKGLMERSFPQVEVHATRWDEQIRFTHEPNLTARAAMGSLARFYRRKTEYFSGDPYLKACPRRRIMYRAALDALGDGLKVGLAWRGGERFSGRESRSIDFAMLAPLLEMQGVHWVDLEYLPDTSDAEASPYIHHWPWATQTDDYDDTAALVAELDLVISICTSVVHLAGALGTECWCLVPQRPNWRFSPAAERPDGTFLWHRSVHLIRQTEHLQWSPVIDTVRQRLHERIYRHGLSPAGRGNGAHIEHHSPSERPYQHHPAAL